MQKLVQGFNYFKDNLFGTRKELFERLANGQNPDALFITCSDSRINPNLLTQTEPGELFILRNAGNIVPPHGAANGGEGATIEYAVAALGVKDIIVCGHSHCGAMNALLHPEQLADLPTVAAWLKHAETTRRVVHDHYRHFEGNGRLLNVAIQVNVLVQLDHLRTHPAVYSALAQGKLKLHGWVYKIETGEVFDFDPAVGQFTPLGTSQAVQHHLSPAQVGMPVAI